MTVSKFKRNRNEIEVVMVATESHIDFHIGKVKLKVTSTISNSKLLMLQNCMLDKQ